VAPQSHSTVSLYQGKWKVFCAWCSDKGKDPWQVRTHHVAQFFLFLFNIKKLSPGTIAGYRTAIASALKHSRRTDFANDPELSALLRSFRRDRPSVPKRFPSWDLSLVLQVISHAPFEPISDPKVPLSFLTWKTAFLVLLASGARRSEVHALTHKGLLHHERWKWVSIRTMPSFVSKTQLRTQGATALEKVSIKALSNSVGRDSAEDLVLCPVRALRAYLARTRDLREGKDLLFISYQQERRGDIAKNTISGWMRKLIKFCYDHPGRFEQVLSLVSTSTHEIRALAASLAFQGSVDLESIMLSCSWKNHSTFTDFYLRDLSALEENLHRLGPLSVAQTSIVP